MLMAYIGKLVQVFMPNNFRVSGNLSAVQKIRCQVDQGLKKGL